MSTTNSVAEVVNAGRCVLCQSADDEIVLRDNGFVGRLCDCGVVYTDPTPSAVDLETISDFHPDSYYVDSAQARFDFVSQVAQRHIASQRPRLLDIGAGHGHVLAAAQAAGYEVAAIEPNPVTAAALERSGITTEHATLQTSTLAPQSFDVVFHIDLLSHFVDPVQALSKMRDLATTDGLVCFEVGVFGGLHPRWYPWIGDAGYPQHLWLYSHMNLQDMLDAAGLEIVERQDHALWMGTLVSSIGNRFLRRAFPKPTTDNGVSAPATGVRRIYGKVQHHLRYTAGRHLPSLGGPQCSFFAVRRAS